MVEPRLLRKQIGSGYNPEPIRPGVMYAQDGQGWYRYTFPAVQTYTPTLKGSGSDPNLGSGGSTELVVVPDGPLYRGFFKITVGTGSSPGTGFYYLDLPASLALNEAWVNAGIGVAELNDSGTGIVMMVRSDPGNDIIFRQASNNTTWSDTNHPIGDNDFMRGSFVGLMDY